MTPNPDPQGGESNMEDEQAVRQVHPDAYINSDYSGAPSADVAVFRKATKEDWPNNHEVTIGNFCGSIKEAWKSARAKLAEGATTQPVAQEGGIKKFFGTWPGAETDEQLLDALAKVRAATPEELVEQGQNLAKNYKPGPRQAQPVPSAGRWIYRSAKEESGPSMNPSVSAPNAGEGQ